MRTNDLNKRLADRPFKPIRMHLSDGKVLKVRNPGMIIVGLSSAIVPTRIGKDEGGFPVVLDWRTVALAHIVRFSDISQRQNGRQRRKP